MILSRLLLVFTLAASATFAQYCDKFDQRQVDSILGGPATPLGMGALGCSYSVRGKSARLTMTISNQNATIQKDFSGLKQKTRASGWLTGDEPTLGNSGFGEWIKPGPKVPSGKIGFVITKGSWLILFYITDTGTLASKKETMDKLRPIAKYVVDRI